MVPEWILDSSISDRAVRLFATLAAKYVDRETGHAFPSRRTLAANVRVALAKTIDPALRELEDIGALITRRRRDSKGGPTSSEYTLRYANPAVNVDEEVVPGEGPYTPESGTTVGPDEGPEIVPAQGPDPESSVPRITYPEREGANAPASSETPEALQALWNELTTSPIPRCQELTPARRKNAVNRLNERRVDVWRGIFANIEDSAFCRGENDHGWVASFDWVIGSVDVAVKVLEGNYCNRPGRERPFTAREIEDARRLRDKAWGGCRHDPRCANQEICISTIIRQWRAEAAS